MNSEQDSKTYVKLVTANGLVEADTWKAVLETSGISVYLRHEAMATVIPEVVGELAAVDLWVPREQATRAMEILQDERVEPPEDEQV